MPRAAREVVRKELDRVLASGPFSESPRCREFLRFVVDAALEGREDVLKERTIGIGVFGRDPSYNTNDDSIVRVKASEVRRRLAQYDMVRHEDQRVRIQLAPGSYAPEFIWVGGTRPLPAAPWFQRWQFWVGTVALVLAAAGLVRWFAFPRSPYDEFWAPVLNAPEPVMLCLAQPGGVYRLSMDALNGFERRVGWYSEPSTIPTLSGMIPSTDLIPARDQYTAVGTAMAAVQLASMLRGAGKLSQVRISEDVSFAELRRFPTILLGGPRANKWTREMSGELRFSFLLKDGVPSVHDRLNEKVNWTPPGISPVGKVTEDYVIVSRALDTKSGQIIISAGGITHYGTQAAGEFLVNPEYLRAGLARLPAGWQKRNLQFVLKTTVIGTNITPPQVIAVHTW